MKQLVRSIAFCFAAVLIAGIFSGCEIIQLMEPVEAPQKTPTSFININILPTLPTLAPEQAKPTSIPQSNILYDETKDVFAHFTPEPVPEIPLQPVVMRGVVSRYDGYSYGVQSGKNEYTIQCDDYCFIVDNQKNLISIQNIKESSEIAVFGVTDNKELSTIHADMIVVKEITKPEPLVPADLSYLPDQITYQEWELKKPPQIHPLHIESIDEEKDHLSENIANRQKLNNSSRTRYTYGYYGESYSAELEYNSAKNRDPNYPTRANFTVMSNGYPFFNFWIPLIESPYYSTWGAISFGGDWFLPIRMTVDINPDPTLTEVVFADRTVMSQLNYDKTYGYLRSFGYSILSDNLFYFFERPGGMGFAINRTDYNLNFDQILFGLVEEYAELNPFYSDYQISFFARRNGKWFYVELNAPEEENYW